MSISLRENTVEVEALEQRYGENEWILRGVDLAVRRGEILTILGGSGCGKTTLLRSLIGLMPPTAGRVRLFGRDVYSLGEEDLQQVLRRVGMLFQHSALFGSMNVGENVALPLREYKRDLGPELVRRTVELKLGLVGLAAAANKMPSELSGGMKKRAALARALVMDPDVIFFDEPTTGLDPITAAELDRLILDTRTAFGTTMIIVTHDLDTAFHCSDRIVMLEKGRVVASGTPQEVRAIEEPRVQNFIERRAERVEEVPVSLDEFTSLAQPRAGAPA
jgi:phospholipid/cholesterol/gamma-HCH transport system ATP-binding protein